MVSCYSNYSLKTLHLELERIEQTYNESVKNRYMLLEAFDKLENIKTIADEKSIYK